VARTRLVATALAVVVALSAPAARSGKTAGRLALQPERVDIDLFFSGARVDVRAEVPAGYEAAVRLASRPERLAMKRLGKRGGVLWMSVGSVTFEGVPAVYQVLSTVPLAELGPAPLLAECGLGYRSLVPDRAPASSLRADLVALKEHEGLFAVRAGGLQQEQEGQEPASGLAKAGIPPAGPGEARVLLGTFRLPAAAPVGDYSVDLIGFRGGQRVSLGRATLRLDYVGAVRTWRLLAMDHGLAYGTFACLIAIVVGLLTGVLFRPKANESH
jgi:hypothetical protein